MRLLLLSRLNCATAQLSYNATIAVVATAAVAAVVVATARVASSALAALATAVVAVAFAVDDDDGTTTRLASFGRNLKTQD